MKTVKNYLFYSEVFKEAHGFLVEQINKEVKVGKNFEDGDKQCIIFEDMDVSGEVIGDLVYDEEHEEASFWYEGDLRSVDELATELLMKIYMNLK